MPLSLSGVCAFPKVSDSGLGSGMNTGAPLPHLLGLVVIAPAPKSFFW